MLHSSADGIPFVRGLRWCIQLAGSMRALARDSPAVNSAHRRKHGAVLSHRCTVAAVPKQGCERRPQFVRNKS
eukprot:6196124-Pleurochrysis_carterae.AAC.2